MRYVCVQRYQDRYKVTQGWLVVNHLHRHTSIPQHLQRPAWGLHSVQTLFVIVQQGNAGAGMACMGVAVAVISTPLKSLAFSQCMCYRTFTFAVASRAGASLMSKPSRFTLVASSL